MNVVAFLASLAKLDIRLWLEGDTLRFSAPEGAFTPAIREQVVTHKAEIIDFLRQARKLNEAPIPVISRDVPVPVSFSQQRLWLLDQINPRDVTYNMSSALRIRGDLRVALLEKVFATLVQRHESLRTRFVAVDGEPFQIVDAAGTWTLPLTDLSALTDAQREARVQAEVHGESLTPYDLAVGPLFRARLLRLGENQHVLIAGMHHIISDAWSMEVLVREIGMLYLAFAAGLPSPLPPLPIQYADYAAWQQQQMSAAEMEKHQQYWQQTLAGAPPVLDIPTDRPRQDIPSSNGALVERSLDAATAAAINAFCSRHELTPFMVLLGAWQLLMGRYGDTRDVVIGAPVAGRSRSETQELIGFFVNMMLLRVKLHGNPTVREFYARVKEVVLGAFGHQDMPVDRLLDVMQVERQPGYPPLAQSLFQLINITEQQAAPLGQAALAIEPIPALHVSARNDLALGVAKTGDDYRCSLEYNTDLFNESTVAGMLDLYVSLLRELTANPERHLDSIELYDDAHLLRQMGLAPEAHSLIRLNSNQLSFWLDEITHTGTAQNAYGNYVALKHRPDLDKLTQAIQSLVDESRLLRARLVTCDLPTADVAYLAARHEQRVHLKIHDGSRDGLTPEQVQALILKLMHRPYALPAEELISYHLVNAGARQVYLVVACHHLLLDGASTYLLMQKILQRYQSLLNGQGVAAVPYAENLDSFLRWDRAHMDSTATLDYWQNALHGVEALNFTRPAVVQQSVSAFNDCLRTVTLPRREVDALRDYCAAQGINLPLYFKTLFGLMLHHYCRPEEAFTFYEFFANRADGWGNSLGCFYQQFPVVFDRPLLRADAALADWFAALKKARDSARDHRSLSLAWQSRQVPQGRNLFMFNYYNFVLDVAVAGEMLQPVMSAPKVDGAVQFIVKEEAGSIGLELRYDVTHFADLHLLERMLGLNRQILSGRADRVADLCFLEPDEQAQLQRWSGVAPAGAAATETLVTDFERQVLASPDNVALIAGGESLNYRQLNEQANRLAYWLIAQGVSANVRVGICLNRSVDLVVAVLAVLKAGGAYVPMDPAYPRERLAFMVQDSAAPLVLTRREFAAALDGLAGEGVPLDALDLSAQPVTNPGVPIDPDQQIYVIYTSGSTGQPKGAMVQHRGESNLQRWYGSELEITAADRTLLISAVGFDLTQKNLFAPLLHGAALVLPSMELFDENELLNLIEQHRVTWVNGAPSAFYPLVESAAPNGYRALHSLRFVVLGGEPIRLSALAPWLTSPGCTARLMNSYGPTECTDVVAWHSLARLESPRQILPIGRPVPGLVLHILNDHLQPVVPGLPGEICVSGIGVGLGYINRDELTQKVFIDNPFGDGKLYRTGDLGRWLPNGDIDYLGRKDFQIKLRGLRIELGEIEHALKQLPGVQDGLALVKDDKLIAYVVSAQAALADDWRARLRDHLPEYMIPAVIVPLAQWPLTPNGKIDRKALPDPAAVLAQAAVYVAPRTELENQLAQIWQELLQKPQVGVLDNLFDLGGNSLLATRILSRVKRQLGVQIPVRELFVAPTVADLAVAINRAQQTANVPPITPVDRQVPQPLSFAQQRLWFLDQLDPGNRAYNMPGALRVRGRLDAAAFEKALAEIAQRHAVLRSTVCLVDEQPCQVIQAGHDWRMHHRDFSDIADESLDAALHEHIARWRQHRFDLAAGPLFVAELVFLRPDDHLLLVNLHHIVSDGWSNGVLMRELGMLYDAFLHGRPSPLPPLRIQYVDFAVWQRNWLSGDERERQLGYWRTQLAGVEVLHLPTDRPRRADSGFDGSILDFALDATLTARLNRLAREQGASLYMTLLSAWMVLLAKYSNQTDIAVGSPIANRNHEDIEPLIGFFVNTLVMRGDLDPQQSFTTLLQQVRTRTLDAYAHQDLPFERLVEELVTERDLLHAPLFQVMFSLQNVPVDTHFTLSGLKLQSLVEQDVMAKFDLSLSLMEIDGGLRGELVYRTALFDRASVEKMLGHYRRVLDAVVAQADVALGAISLLDEQERQQIYALSLASVTEPMPQHTLLHAWQQQGVCQPDALAVVDDDQHWTFAELDRRATALAQHLRRQGVAAGERVGIHLPRSAHTLLSILAIWKAGAGYVPLDVNYPDDRLHYMLENSRLRVVLTDASRGARLMSLAPVTLLDVTQPLTATDDPLPLPALDDTAYVIYTSGTTGRPKGVCIRHESAENLRQALNERIYDQSPRPVQRVAINASFSFDASVKQIIQLFNGRTLLPVPDDVRLDIDALKHWLLTWQVDGFDCTPSQLQALLGVVQDDEWPAFPHCVLIGGEAIGAGFWQQLAALSRKTGIRFFNVYGPTECTVDVTALEISDRYPQAVLGKPLRQYGAWILDSRQQLLPVGVVGELCVSGVGLASGYLHQPELTAEKFVEPIAGAAVPVRFYRTGDLACWNAAGELVYVGRVDNQVKIRGYRVELEEVESAISRHPSVRQAAVKVVRQGPRERLCAWLVLAEGETLTGDDLGRFLRDTLPDYMVPDQWLELPALPLTPNGKVARNLLPAPAADSPERACVPPATATEKSVLAIWQAVLGSDAISVEDDFFAVGGHSLFATQVVSRLRREFRINLPLRALFEAPTVRNTARQIDRILQESRHSQLPPVVRVDRNGPLPLSFVQQQLWLLDQLDPGTPAYNMPVALRIDGDLDLAAFEQAFLRLIERHETLRTNFVAVNGEPRALIRADAHWPLEQIDLSGLDRLSQEEKVRETVEQQAGRGFDLARDRLIRGTLIRLGTDDTGTPRFVFAGAVHHIVSDGWSRTIMVSELLAFYRAQVQGQPAPLPPLDVQYVDVAAWQRQWLQGDVLDAHLAFWRDQLDNEYQVLDLPTDFPRPPVQTSHGASARAALPATLVARAQQLAREEGATLFMVLLAAYQRLLGRYAGQARVNVGTPIAGRDTVETEALVGFFINTVVMSTDVSGDPSFRTLLRRAREVALGAYAHQALPFEKIVEELRPRRDTSRTPFFQVFLNLLNLPPRDDSHGDLHIEPLLAEESHAHAKYDLNLYATETGGDLELMLVYNADLFRPDTVDRLLADLGLLLEQALAQPDDALHRLDTLTAADRAWLPDLTQPIARSPFRSPVERFLQQAARTPDAVALVTALKTWHYGELEQASAAVSAGLQQRGLGEGDAVAVLADRSAGVVIALLGILRAGALFSVLDTGYPAERLMAQLNVLQPRALLVATTDEQPLRDDIEIPCLLLRDLMAVSARSAECHDMQHRAYVAFTSGTTGEPKGIVGRFAPVAHFVDEYLRQYSVTAADRFSLLSGLAHDPLLRDIFVPLAAGAALVIPPQPLLADPDGLRHWFARENISCTHLTPALCRVLTASTAEPVLTALRLAGFGGDRLTLDVVNALRAIAPAVQPVNFYGTTETPQVMATFPVPADFSAGSIPLGRGIDGVQLLVLDEHLNPCAPGCVGQIVIRTPWLTDGYLNGDDSGRYRPNPHRTDPDDRLYLTGDRGRFRREGDVEFLGRIDQQIKIRGFRIEPAEIQGAIQRFDCVRDVVVVAAEDPRGEPCLVAYLVPADAAEGWQDLLKAGLRQHLPDYMVPALFIALERIPLTPNGKLDRRALPSPAEHWQQREYQAPRTAIETEIAAIWQEVMKQTPISVLDHFFDIGGHSLLAVQIVTRVKDRYQVEFSMRRLFEVATIAGMASYVENALWLRQPQAETSPAGDDFEEIEI